LEVIALDPGVAVVLLTMAFAVLLAVAGVVVEVVRVCRARDGHRAAHVKRVRQP
jgi:heme/copper-type cytochrome/quinol oxidase subunit 2